MHAREGKTNNARGNRILDINALRNDVSIRNLMLIKGYRTHNFDASVLGDPVDYRPYRLFEG